MEPYLGMKHLCESMHGIIASNKEGGLDLMIPRMFRGEMMDRLAMTAAIGDSEEVRNLARIIIRSAAMSHNIWCDSINPIYKSIGRGKSKPLTIPAFSIRGLTYFIARSIFRVARREKVGPFIFELSPVEIECTGQAPLDYTTAVLAAALREHYQGPIFIQGDHFREDKSLLKDAIDSGFYNFNLNGTHPENGHLPRTNQKHIESLIENMQLISKRQPRNIVINVGGSLAETASATTSVNGVRKYLNSFTQAADSHDLKTSISKLSVHVTSLPDDDVDPDGNSVSTEIDFHQLKSLSDVVRNEFSLAGTIIQGASIIPENAFSKLTECGVAEIHLGTILQNLIFDHPRFPAGLREEIHSYLETHYADARHPDWSDQQFYYKLRIKTWKHFKKTLWTLDHRTRSVICSSLEDRITLLFDEVNLRNSQKIIKNFYGKMRPVPITIPDELRAL